RFLPTNCWRASSSSPYNRGLVSYEHQSCAKLGTMNIGISRTAVRLFLCLLFLASAVNLARVGALPSLPLTSRATAPSFRAALPGYKYSFPRDHGAHPEFQTEWWYYTGHLQSTQGETFGYQLTFFRTALTPNLQSWQSNWATRDVIFAHLALTDE